MKLFKSFYTILTAIVISLSQAALADAAASASASVIASPSEIAEQPVALLERTSEQVIKILREDQELLKKEPQRVYKLIDDYILPHLDDVTMAKLALGKHWKKASNEQKLAFVDEFRNMLVRTYSKSLLEFRDQTIRYFPLKLADDARKTSVRAEVLQPGGPSIPLAYRMRVKGNAWKVYDIKVDGISLVTSYRGTFSQEIRKSGMNGLIQYMREQNKQLKDRENT